MSRCPLRCAVALLISFMPISALLAQDGKRLHLEYADLSGTMLRYKQTARLETTQEFMGSQMQSQGSSEGVVVITGEPPEGDNLVFVQTTEFLTIEVSGARMDSVFQNPPEVVGKRVRKVVRPNGDQVASVELDEFQPLSFAPGYSSEQEFLPNLPAGELVLGDSVSAVDSDTTHTLDGETISEFNVTYTYAGDEERSGKKCAVVKMRGTVNVQGDGFIRGMKFFMEGEGTLTGQTLFAPDAGIMVATETNMVIESTIALSGAQNMTIPNRQVANSSIELLP